LRVFAISKQPIFHFTVGLGQSAVPSNAAPAETSAKPVSGHYPSCRHPCKLTRAFGPRNSMKIAQSQAIIQNGWEWRDRKDNGDAEAECKFDPSFVEGEKDSPDARLGGARTIEAIRIRSSHVWGRGKIVHG